MHARWENDRGVVVVGDDSETHEIMFLDPTFFGSTYFVSFNLSLLSIFLLCLQHLFSFLLPSCSPYYSTSIHSVFHRHSGFPGTAVVSGGGQMPGCGDFVAGVG